MHNHLTLGQIVWLLSSKLGWTTLLNVCIASERTDIGITAVFRVVAAEEPPVIAVDIGVTSTAIHLVMHRLAWTTLCTSLSFVHCWHGKTATFQLLRRTIHDRKSTIILADVGVAPRSISIVDIGSASFRQNTHFYLKLRFYF